NPLAMRELFALSERGLLGKMDVGDLGGPADERGEEMPPMTVRPTPASVRELVQQLHELYGELTQLYEVPGDERERPKQERPLRHTIAKLTRELNLTPEVVEQVMNGLEAVWQRMLTWEQEITHRLQDIEGEQKPLYGRLRACGTQNGGGTQNGVGYEVST